MVAVDSNILSSAFRLAGLTIVFQTFFRLSSFITNSFVLRFLHRYQLGISAQLSLLGASITFFSREAFRKSCVSSTSSQTELRKLISLLWLVPWLGILWSALLIPLWAWSVPVFPTVLFALGAFMELMSEPFHIVLHLHLIMGERVAAEGWAQLLRCLFIACLVPFYTESAPLIFAIGQIIYGSIVFAFMTWRSYLLVRNKKLESVREFRDLLPSQFLKLPLVACQAYVSKSSDVLDVSQLFLVVSFFGQCIVKQILTEGEKYILIFSNLLTLSEQGLLDSINNIGSLAARLIFLPIEDGSYHFFTKIFTRGSTADSESPGNVKLAKEYLINTLRLASLFGLIFAVFGMAYSNLLLFLYSGSLLSSGEGPNLLRLFCFYVLLLSWNGVSEGFMFAVMDKKQVDVYNKRLMYFSVVFVVTAIGLTVTLRHVMPSFGFSEEICCAGFILANCLNMLLRIQHNCNFIYQFFGSLKLSAVTCFVPHPAVCVAFLLSAVFTSLSMYVFLDSFTLSGAVVHVLLGGSCLAQVVTSIIWYERELMHYLHLHLFSRFLSLRTLTSISLAGLLTVLVIWMVALYLYFVYL